MLEMLDNTMIFLLQEAHSWRDTVFRLYHLYSAPGMDFAIGIPRAWQANVRDVVHSQYFSFVLVGVLLLGSIHLPTSQAPNEIWFSTMDGVNKLMTQWRQQQRFRYAIIGADLNFTLRAHLGDLTGGC